MISATVLGVQSMGSSNSGNHGGKRCTRDMWALDVRKLQCDGRLKSEQWYLWPWSRRSDVPPTIRARTDDGVVNLDYRTRGHGGEWQQLYCPVRVTWTNCNYGGQRAWWLCPTVGCGRRVAVLYVGKVCACRHCHNLAYQSQREQAADRAICKADALRKRLGWVPGILHGEGGKPKGMHWKTYNRLRIIYYAQSNKAFGGMGEKLKILRGRMGV
jgi:hypothetical protein